MELTKVLLLCISCFSLGFGLCGFIFGEIDLARERRRRKNAQRCKELLQEWEDKLIPRERCNPHKPIERLPGESTEQFIDRLERKIAKNEITANAARASVGLPPLNDMPDDPEKDCLTCEYNENGINRPCKECIDFSKWKPEGEE